MLRLTPCPFFRPLPHANPPSVPLTICLLGLFALLPAALAVGGSKENPQQEAATLELKGLLVPLHQANLSSRSTGLIRTMKEEGEEFHKGDLLVALDDDNEKLAVESAQSVLNVRTREKSRSDELVKKGTESTANQDIAKANYETAAIQLKQAEVALDKKYVYAPFDGVVTKRIRQPGEATDNFLSVADGGRPLPTLLGNFLARQPPARRAARPDGRDQRARPARQEVHGQSQLHRPGD